MGKLTGPHWPRLGTAHLRTLLQVRNELAVLALVLGSELRVLIEIHGRARRQALAQKIKIRPE
jgi:hypothetical protein